MQPRHTFELFVKESKNNCRMQFAGSNPFTKSHFQPQTVGMTCCYADVGSNWINSDGRGLNYCPTFKNLSLFGEFMSLFLSNERKTLNFCHRYFNIS